MIRPLLLLAALSCGLFAASTAADLARSVREAGLDADECYRVRDLNFTHEDIKFYLTDGFVVLSKPAGGRRTFLLFSADVEGGDAELILLPPFRSERQSLANFTGSPNLNEHFKTGLFVFTQGIPQDLSARIQETGKKSAERGLLLSGQYSSVARNIGESFQLRLVEDLLNPGAGSPLLFAAIGGGRLGNFDVIADPRAREQIMVGQLRTKGNSLAYDIWASFESRSVRKGSGKKEEPAFGVSDYRIEAALDDELHLAATTKMKITVGAIPVRAFALQISDRMQISEVRLDGQPVELYRSDSLRTAAMTGGGSSFFLVIAPEPVGAGTNHELEFKHDGDVVFRAGNGVYAVGARGTWYPHRAAEFTRYDLRFRYPKRLNLVSTGEVIEDQVDGATRITHRRTSAPVRFAGFNLGEYEKVTMHRGGYAIEVYGNRRVEPVLEPRPAPPPSTPPRLGRRMPDILTPTDAPPPPNPAAHLLPLAEEVAGAFEFMTKQFGPAPLKTLTVSPIPGAFGQGFPGLVYLSTISYISPEQRPSGLRDRQKLVFFSDLLAPHEIAHQWWGNLVTSAAYQDAWLMEALANYTSLLYLEKRKGSKALESVLDEYRARLLTKREGGDTVESLGPITWGTRLETTDGASARTIVYEKGSWILHMLRIRMGDERFFKMLNELCRRYQYKTISTNDFQSLAEEFLPAKGSLSSFFESWVHGTGIPAFKVTSSTKGKAPAFQVSATVAQSEVDEDFTAEAPLEVQFAGGAPALKWVRTSNEPVTVTVPVKRAPVKVFVSPFSILCRR